MKRSALLLISILFLVLLICAGYFTYEYISDVFMDEKLIAPPVRPPFEAPPPPQLNLTDEMARKAGCSNKEEILFWKAIQNESTAPPYVLITLAKNDSYEKTCILVTSLKAAIHEENNIPYSDNNEDILKMRNIALHTKGRIFRFTNPAALSFCLRSYNDKDLDEMRKALGNYSNNELIEGFGIGGKLHDLYRKADRHSKQDAAAHILLERGLLPGRGCTSSQMWVVK